MRDHSDHSPQAGAPAAACRHERWRRSTWHRLLAALDEHTAHSPRGVDALLGASPDRVRRWLDSETQMPPAMQWRLMVAADALLGADPAIARLSRALRGQLEATAAYLDRGPLRVRMTLEEAHANQLAAHGALK